uniref:Putative secreted peptide n=1 Tax=Anopheles braziliensis TaxID=58242 RepID=A0A2M3ZP14_9DIPT
MLHRKASWWMWAHRPAVTATFAVRSGVRTTFSCITFLSTYLISEACCWTTSSRICYRMMKSPRVPTCMITSTRYGEYGLLQNDRFFAGSWSVHYAFPQIHKYTLTHTHTRSLNQENARIHTTVAPNMAQSWVTIYQTVKYCSTTTTTTAGFD